jgi:hypothetical protein
MTQDKSDAQNCASEFMFWDLMAQAYKNRYTYRFVEVLFDSEKLLKSTQGSLTIIAPQNSK